MVTNARLVILKTGPGLGRSVIIVTESAIRWWLMVWAWD